MTPTKTLHFVIDLAIRLVTSADIFFLSLFHDLVLYLEYLPFAETERGKAKHELRVQIYTLFFYKNNFIRTRVSYLTES